jgi:hypothetical protein
VLELLEWQESMDIFGGGLMKAVVICRDSSKFKEFLENQGSVVVDYAFDNIYNNLDTLSNNIVRVDKFIVIHDPTSELAQEVRGVLSLLENPTGLLKVKEYVFMYKDDHMVVHNKQILNVVQEKIKEKAESNPKWEAPHMSIYALDVLDYDSIYRTIMGKSTYDLIDPTTMIKYRQERGEESKKSFEYHRVPLTIHAKDSTRMASYESLKDLLAKTENPSQIYDLESLIPEYDDISLQQYSGTGAHGTKVVVFVGDRMSGSTTHMISMAVSAVEADQSVFVLDLSISGGASDMMDVANYEHYKLSNKEMLNNYMALDAHKLCVFECDDGDTFFRILTYVQARPNIFHSDLLFINCNLAKLDTVLSIFNSRFCSVVVSSLLYRRSLDILLKLDTNNSKTLVWLNDNIDSPLRQNKHSVEFFKQKVKEVHPEWKFMSPVFFEDFEVDSSIFESVEGVI